MANLLNKMPLPFEPKKQNRFIIRFPSALGLNEWQVKSASRPKITISEIEIPFLNTFTYVAGNFKWEAMSVVFRDTIGPSTTQAIMEWVRLHAESVTGRMGYAAGYKKNVELEMLDPSGVVVEKWILEGCFITSADFGTLDYGSAEIAEVTLELRYDRGVLVY